MVILRCPQGHPESDPPLPGKRARYVVSDWPAATAGGGGGRSTRARPHHREAMGELNVEFLVEHWHVAASLECIEDM